MNPRKLTPAGRRAVAVVVIVFTLALAAQQNWLSHHVKSQVSKEVACEVSKQEWTRQLGDDFTLTRKLDEHDPRLNLHDLELRRIGNERRRNQRSQLLANLGSRPSC